MPTMPTMLELFHKSRKPPLAALSSTFCLLCGAYRAEVAPYIEGAEKIDVLKTADLKGRVRKDCS